nr:hypothetical protein [Methylobacterium durans]
MRELAGAAHRDAETYQSVSDVQLRAEAYHQRVLWRLGTADNACLVKTHALIAEASRRTLGLVPHVEQHLSGIAMARGAVVEMQTGEGKTLTAAFPAVLAAFRGYPVHVVTSNDYLATRDGDALAPLYASLGLTTGSISEGSEPSARRAAYAADVTYVSNKELAFDFLRDRVTRLQSEAQEFETSADILIPRLGQCIVDEADSVLVDEARTPLILSEGQGQLDLAEGPLEAILEIARGLREGGHFRRLAADQLILTPAAYEQSDPVLLQLDPLLRNARLRRTVLHQALMAIHGLHLNQDYIVVDGSIQIIDEYTGRSMPDRAWSDYLQAFVEIKENCRRTGTRSVLASTTYQKFFRRYEKLCGMTGTAAEVSQELHAVYGLRSCPIPSHRPTRRARYAPAFFRSSEEKWPAVARRATEMRATGRPVLIGVRSVEATLAISQRLAAHDVPHQVLSALNHAAEADIVARAGEAGAVTVATSMGGRGTDIRLSPAAKAAGGLHVIIAEAQDARRIERQLAGRSARQGDPGSFECMLASDEPLLRSLSARFPSQGVNVLGSSAGLWLLRCAQQLVERRHRQARRLLTTYDERYDRMLAFLGKPD